jgi:hypothetical protein
MEQRRIGHLGYYDMERFAKDHGIDKRELELWLEEWLQREIQEYKSDFIESDEFEKILDERAKSYNLSEIRSMIEDAVGSAECLASELNSIFIQMDS